MNEQAVQEARRYLAMLHKRRGLLIACVSLALVVAVVYNYATRPLFQATAQILIDRDTPNVLPTKEILEANQGAADYFQTQFELLRGRMLAEKVVERLGLNKSVELQTGPLMSPWERIQRKFFGRQPATAVDNDGIPLAPAVAAFRSRMIVEPVRGSRLVNLRFNAYDPRLAAQVANAVAQTYIEQALEFRYTTSSEATGWLTDRVEDQKKRVEDAEKALQEYREKEKIVNIEERQSLVDQKLSALTAAAITARTDRINRETLYNQMRALPSSQLETFPIVLSNPLVQQLRARIGELQRERERLSESYGEKHPEMVRAATELRSTEEKLRSEMQNVVRSVESDYRTAAQQEANLQANLEATKQEALDLNRKAISYNVLKREVEANQQLFRELVGRTKEAGLESELRSTNIRIVEKAQVPVHPVQPQKMRNYQLALLLGLALGIGLCVLFEHLDNTYKTPEDIKNHLGLPFLGMVPDAAPKAAPAQGRAPVTPHRSTQSGIAEAYRILRTNLIFSLPGTAGRAILVTSANPGEGKTTTALNLAESLAHNGARVLAVDADLRRPTLHQRLNVPKTPGLSDLIVGKSQPSQAIHATSTKGLQVLSCGYIPPNPAELLGSAAMADVVRALREHYDWVLIDTPPALAMADTPVLCPLVDGVVLVVGAEVGSRPTVQRTADQLQAIGAKIVGVVLNKVDLERNAYYYSQYYGEYYRSYYADRGQADSPRVASASRGPRPVRKT
jgi:capsular exopolysaccharide synthesis family protein